MATSSEVREQIVRFLNHEVSISDLDEWITRNTWNMHITADANTRSLVGDIELRIADFGSGRLSLQEATEELRKVLNGSILEFGFDETKAASGVSSRLIELRLGPQQAQTGIRWLTAA